VYASGLSKETYIIYQSKRTDEQTGFPKPIVAFRNTDNLPKTLSQCTQIIILPHFILINLPDNFQKFLAGSTRDPRAVSSRIIFLSLLLLSLFLSTSYSAIIVSLLQTTSTVINSLRDLMDSPFTLSMMNDEGQIYYVNVSLIFKKVNSDKSINNLQLLNLSSIHRLIRKNTQCTDNVSLNCIRVTICDMGIQ